MTGRQFDMLLLLGIAAVLGLIWLLVRLLFSAPAPAAAPTPEALPAPGLATTDRAALRSSSPHVDPGPAPTREGPRGNDLPRPPPEQLDAGLKPVAQRGPKSGPIDRRENAGPRAQQELEMVRYAFETMDEDIRACLEQWEAVEPGQAGQVMIGFEIDANGLQRSWLDHDGGVPFGPRTCLANAVYGIDWSHIVDHPAMLTNRFELGRDAGA